MILISHIINCKYLIVQTIALVTILTKKKWILALKHSTFMLLASRLSYFQIWSAMIIKANLSAVQWCPMAPQLLKADDLLIFSFQTEVYK